MARSYHQVDATTPHGLHDMLAQFPVVCFTLTLLTDIAYWRTSHLLWHDFSAWLLFAGVVTGILTLVVAIIEYIARPALRRHRGGNGIAGHMLGGLVVLALGFLNSLVHAADGWWAIMPWGLTLSALTVVAILTTAWLTYRMRRDTVIVREGLTDHG
jgi:uncharacterized membrane protein